MKKSSIEDFRTALNKLDDLLVEEGLDAIDIYAIGGFAMLYYGVRKNGFTIDIDSLTKNYDSKVINLIKVVGAQLGLDTDWLNTDCAALDGFLSLADTIEWKKTDYVFQRINLMVADIPGLIKTKAKAIHDGGLVPRTTDKKDLVAALKYIGIENIQVLDTRSEYGFIKEQFEKCYDYLKQIQKW